MHAKILQHYPVQGVGIVQPAYRLSMGSKVRDSNLRMGNGQGTCLLRARRNWFWGTASHLYIEHQGSFTGVKPPGRDVSHLSSSSAEIKNEYSYTLTQSLCLHDMLGVNLYLSLSCSGKHKSQRCHQNQTCSKSLMSSFHIKHLENLESEFRWMYCYDVGLLCASSSL